MNNEDTKFDNHMMSGWIKDLESSDSRLHKEAVIEKALMASKLGSMEAQGFLFNCYQTYNPFYIFNIKKVPETVGLQNKNNPWTKFWGLLEALRTRSVTGNAARLQIDQLSQEFDSEEWNMVCRRVITKDLRCGISEKTLNKILSKTEWRIPTFSCQLAQDSADHPAKLTGPKRLEVKLDGVRVLAVVVGTSITLYSRNGKTFENFPQIEDSIRERLHLFRRHSWGQLRFVLDGEIVGESFQSLMRQAHRKSNAKTDNMVYHIFDIMPLDSFERGFDNQTQRRRLETLLKLKSVVETSSNLKIMEGIEVNLSNSEGHDVMHRFAQDAVSKGFEGIMIKALDAPYECKRNDFWMKWKPTISVDLTVVDFEEGTGRNESRLGALVCEGVDMGRQIKVNVGSGFTDEDRTSFWKHRKTLKGHIVEVQADVVSQNQDGSYSLRFPRFLRFRSFNKGEKV